MESIKFCSRDPFDPMAFKTWALKAECSAVPAALILFNKLMEKGIKIFLITGRDEITLGQATLDNLYNQGFIGYERLILRYTCLTYCLIFDKFRVDCI